jgi:transcriptional regulator with XRE-family HTH domain
VRKKLRFTQIEFAKTLNVSKSSIINYESNKRYPDSNFIICLISHFRVSARWLLIGEGEMFRHEHELGDVIDEDLIELVELSQIIPEIKSSLLTRLTELKEIFKNKVAEYEKVKKKESSGDTNIDTSEAKTG